MQQTNKCKNQTNNMVEVPRNCWWCKYCWCWGNNACQSAPMSGFSIFCLTSQDQDWPPLKQAWQIWSDLRWFPECWRKNFMYQLSASITQPIYPFPPKLLLRILEMVWLPRQWVLRGLLWSAPQECAAKLPLTHSKAFQCCPKDVFFWMKFKRGLW